MRWHILTTLTHKECLRHWANRGGLVMSLMLVGFALLLSASRRAGGVAAGGGNPLDLASVQKIYVDYAVPRPWVDYLRAHLPPGLGNRVQFRRLDRAVTNARGLIVYDVGTGAIQLRLLPDGPGGTPRVKVQVWHPEGDPRAMAAFEEWFWQTSAGYFAEQAAKQLGDRAPPAADAASPWAAAHRAYRDRALSAAGPSAAAVAKAVPELEVEYAALSGEKLAAPSLLASALVMFAIFFASVYLLPSLTCEERERGILLAQALSPASPLEILTAKFLVHAALAAVLAAAVAAAYNPAAVARGYFWATVGVLTAGSLGIGLVIACLARTQRAASMGSLCYMLAVALFLLICTEQKVPVLPLLALEYHAPHLLHAALGEAPVEWSPNVLHLLGTVPVAAAWVVAAAVVFRRRGWQ